IGQITVTASRQAAFLLADEQRAFTTVNRRGCISNDAGQKRADRYGTCYNPPVIPEQIKQGLKAYCIGIVCFLTLFRSKQPSIVSAVIRTVTAVRIISVVQRHPFGLL